jgi:hypothetical protein
LEVYENQGDFFGDPFPVNSRGGMGLGVSGIVFTIWFFFLSSSESRYIWGVFSIAEFLQAILYIVLLIHTFMMNNLTVSSSP